MKVLRWRWEGSTVPLQCSAVGAAVRSGVSLSIVKFSEMKFRWRILKVLPKALCEGERNRQNLPYLIF